MPTNFPTTLDNFTNPTSTDTMDSATVPHATQHANINDAVEALEAKVGVNSSAVTTSLDYKVTDLVTRVGVLENAEIPDTIIDAKGDLIVGSAADTATRLAVGVTNGMYLAVNSATATGLEWQTPTAGVTTGKAIAMAMVFG